MNFNDAQATLDLRERPAGVRISADEISTGIDDAHGIDPAEAKRIAVEQRSKLFAKLVEIAKELLTAAGLDGVGFDDVRIAAQTRNILTGVEPLSFGSVVMESAGGRRVRFRRSKMPSAQRRAIGVYVLASLLDAMGS